MSKLLVVGMPGSGKSTLVGELTSRRVSAFDADEIPGIWRVSSEAPQEDAELDGSNYVWDIDVMRGFVASRAGPLIVAGIAHNFYEAVPLFGQTLFLDVDKNDLRQRLASSSRTNSLGKTEESAAALFEFLPAFCRVVGELGIHRVDARGPITEVADLIETYL